MLLDGNDQVCVCNLILILIEVLATVCIVVVSLQTGVLAICGNLGNQGTVVVLLDGNDQVCICNLVLILVEVLVTLGALIMRFQAGLSASCRNFRNQSAVGMCIGDDQILVGNFVLILVKVLVTYRTLIVCLQTGVLAICGNLGNQVAVGVCQGSDDQGFISDLNLVGIKVLVTYRTLIVCLQASLTTGGLLGGHPITVVVTSSRNLLDLCLAAIGTGVENLALGFAARSGNFHAIVPLMSVEQIQLCTDILNADVVIYAIALNQNLLAQEFLALSDAIVVITSLAVLLQERTEGAAVAVQVQLPQKHSTKLNCQLEAQHFIINCCKDLSLCFVGQRKAVDHTGKGIRASVYLVPAINDLCKGQSVVYRFQFVHIAVGIVRIQGCYQLIPDIGITGSQDHRSHYHILGIVTQIHYDLTGKVTGNSEDLICQTARYIIDGNIDSDIVLDDILQCLGLQQQIKTQVTGDYNSQRTGLSAGGVTADAKGIVRIAVVIDLFCGDTIAGYQSIRLIDHTVAAVLQCFIQSIVIGEGIHNLLCNILQIFLGNPALQGIDEILLLAIPSDHANNIICLNVKYLLAIQIDAGIDVVIQSKLHSCIHSDTHNTLSIDHLKQIIIICIQCQRQVVSTVICHSKQLVVNNAVCFLHIAIRQQCGNIT